MHIKLCDTAEVFITRSPEMYRMLFQQKHVSLSNYSRIVCSPFSSQQVKDDTLKTIALFFAISKCAGFRFAENIVLVTNEYMVIYDWIKMCTCLFRGSLLRYLLAFIKPPLLLLIDAQGSRFIIHEIL